MKPAVSIFIIFAFMLPTPLPAQQFPRMPTPTGPQLFIEEPDEIQKKSEQLAKSPILEKESILIRELERVDNEIANVAAIRNVLQRTDPKYIEQIMARLTKSRNAIAAYNCNVRPEGVRENIVSLGNDYNRLTTALQASEIDLDTTRLGPFFFPIDQAGGEEGFCKQIKTRYESQDYADGQRATTEEILKSASSFAEKQNKTTSVYAGYLDTLRTRRSLLQEKLNTIQPALQIGGNLPWLLLILGIACVMTILGIKLFDKDIQMEWVASGQVIQFVTVMVLLSVVLALGLSAILKENTLGTLLGGIAGYVLAQGVGKAAARDVVRSHERIAAGAAASAKREAAENAEN